MNYFIKKMLAISIAAVTLFGFTQCKSSSKAVTPSGRTKVDLPCQGPDFKSNVDYFRAFAMGTSSDMQISREKADANAKAKLASDIETIIKGMTDNYKNSTSSNGNEEAVTRFESLNRLMLKQTLSGTRTICDETYTNAAGNYETYVVVEQATSNFLGAMNKGLNNDEKLRIDYGYEKYKKDFEEQMRQLDDK